ncbi:MAG: LLM class F420-dependent oxidoreductase [Chloroflexi bacterium]|nr:LLM class F420-dependent oxidoreductase [Chloroflexota bacterium]
MLIGVAVPYYEQYAHYETVVAFSRRAEALGFDALWFADHVALPGYDVPRMGGRWFEMLTLMSNVAALVPRIRLGTDVLVAPYRHPVLAAKMLTTLDIVSGGRLIIGVGGGYVKEEFEALGAPYFLRGNYTDECIRVWKAMWGDGRAAFDGRFFSFEDIVNDPKPVQRPHPPIWIGNAGPRVLRRVAELGDGWHPVGLDFERIDEGIKRLHAFCDRLGRRQVPSLSYSGLFGLVTERAIEGDRRGPLQGELGQVIEDVQRFKELGFDSILFRIGVQDGTPDLMLKQLDLISKRILPKV